MGAGQIHADLVAMIRGLRPQFKRRSRIVDAVIGGILLIIFAPLRILGNVLVFRKIKAVLGGRFIAGVSGGGALPSYVDRFFSGVGIMLLEGYGLTETGPLLAIRKLAEPVRGTVGPLIRDTQYKVLGDDAEPLPPGKKGVLHVKSEQVMKGYYKRPDATGEVLKDGWLNTGDIVMFTHRGELKIVGRAKETIVLLGGENIEPTPIEDRLKQSDLVDQIMVVGQDRKFLGALIVPNQEVLEERAHAENISHVDYGDLLESPEVQVMFQNDVQSLVSTKSGFKPFERIFRFQLIEEPFKVGVEMTHTLKIKRNVVTEIYQKELDKLFN